ncbi:MAG: septum formation inhibitor Maf [Flavobacteriales bacterium]|nr:septum formation inhibitor Maf [Flavobacteriales bacterium]
MNVKNTLTLILVGLFLLSCSNDTSQIKRDKTPIKLTKEFKAYWYNNEAEITSYQLEQARYGEIHTGNAVLVFVTEPFSIVKQVKADHPTERDVSVLKLNFTKKFITGIYPYSMMTSSFTPLDYFNKHALKTTTSSQEWCGHSYMQMNKKKGKYEVSSFSYFESEGDQQKQVDVQWLEDEIWTKIRINPELLPEGKAEMIPSSFYIRLMHKELKAYQVELTKTKMTDELNSYKIVYEDLGRELIITYRNAFPFSIESWEESYVSGWGEQAQQLTTKATKLKTIKSDYWTKNGVKDLKMRELLLLDKE